MMFSIVESLRTSLVALRDPKVAATVFLGASLLLLPQLARAENRSYDGTGNNLAHPTWGAALTPLARMNASAYADGFSTPSGAARPNPRVISNTIVAQSTSRRNSLGLSDWVFQWGQFIDHDLDLTGAVSPAESFNIPIPAGDPVFDPLNTGTAIMPFRRSLYDHATGTGPGNPREQMNEITSYIDASMVYGSDEARALALRTLSGGKLKTSAGDLLPFNTLGLPNGTGGHPDPTQFFVAGDVRVNEQVGLTAAHTLLVREHNRLAEAVAAEHPDWTDEEIYQRARKIVGAEVQVVTYNEFLPALLGPHALSLHSIYDPDVAASVLTEFSTAFFRVGHTMLSPRLLRVQNDGTPAPGGPIPLRDAFFQSHNITSSAELDYLLKGLATQRQQEIDNQIVDDVRNFLFGEPTPGSGFDLAALNIQRGRDHGLPDYNSLRVAFGLPAVTSFAEISSDPDVQTKLQSLYGDVNDIDPWIGGLAEDHLPGASVGSLVAAALIEQFSRARDCDRFWFESDPDFSPDEIQAMYSTRLSDLIRNNSGISNIQENVFFAVPEPPSALLLLFALACLLAPLANTFGRGLLKS